MKTNAEIINGLAIMASMITIARITEQFNHIRKTQDVNGRTMRYTCLGVLTSTIWILYMLHNGNTIGLTVVSTSLLLELYVLRIILTQRQSLYQQR